MYLNRDHGERVNIRFLGGILFAEDFRSRPSRGVDVLTCISPDGIHVFRHDSDAKIRNARMGDVVNNLHEYVHLVNVNMSTVSRYSG